MSGGKYPRLLLGACASGSGKTTITCGLLQALKNRGLSVASFKCGPDYIDPMFHTRVIGAKSRNLDTFFSDEELTRYLFARNAADADISVMEGVMGYYDGLGGISDQASSYDLARVTNTPAVLIVDARGMSVSALACIKGFCSYRPKSQIQGVILNHMPQAVYQEMKPRIEEELGVRVYGYVPRLSDCTIESRHLGLVLPKEVESLGKKLQTLAGILEETLDVDGLIALAKEAEPFLEDAFLMPKSLQAVVGSKRAEAVRAVRPVIAVARDEAFCFLYEDNLQLLRSLGAELVEFSPLADRQIPKEADGLLLFGGYPELHAQRLSDNTDMLGDIRARIRAGLPCMAECGGFLYLHRTMEDMQGKKWPMAGVIDADAYRTEKLSRFGYITLQSCRKEQAESLRGHEFHYFESTDNGMAYTAKKPLRKRSWQCIHETDTLFAGFPHLYYCASPQFALEFCEKCAAHKTKTEKRL